MKINEEIALDANNAILRAHFPGYPVLPGSCIVQLCEDLCAKTLGDSCHIREIKMAKFLVPIQPAELPSIMISLDINDSDVHALVASPEGKTLAKLQFSL